MSDKAALEKAANLFATNAIFAFEQVHDHPWFHVSGHDMAIEALRCELLSVMPSSDGYLLAAACNRGLGQSTVFPSPRILLVDPRDGSVTVQME